MKDSKKGWWHSCHISRKNYVLTEDECSRCGQEKPGRKIIGKHTQGPLHVEYARSTHEGGKYFVVTGQDAISTPDGRVIAEIGDDLDEDEANAYLYAAAPGMYVEGRKMIDDSIDTGDGMIHVEKDNFEAFVAAITKARKSS